MIAISKEQVIETVLTMQDIDGYRSGDCVSRRAVIALLDAIDEIDIDFLDAFVDDGK